MTATPTGSLYLSNNLRLALGLNSYEPAHRVKTKAEAWAEKKGRVIYIPGLGEIGGEPPEPPVDKTLGDCTISGSGISDGSVSLTVGDTLDLAAARDGDANPVTYKWSVRSGDAISFVGVTNKAVAQITATKAGMATFRCMFTATATDSPQEATVSVVVAEPALGLSAEVTKAPSTTPDDVGVITISGGKSSRASVLNYTFRMDGRSETPKSVDIPSGSTAIQAATALVNAFTDPDVTVTRTGGGLTFAPESGSFLAKLTVEIS